MVIMKSSVFSVNYTLLPTCCTLVYCLAYLSTLKMEAACSSERRLTFNGLQGVMSQETEFLIELFHRGILLVRNRPSDLFQFKTNFWNYGSFRYLDGLHGGGREIVLSQGALSKQNSRNTEMTEQTFSLPSGNRTYDPNAEGIMYLSPGGHVMFWSINSFMHSSLLCLYTYCVTVVWVTRLIHLVWCCNVLHISLGLPIAVAVRSNAWTVFARSNIGIVVSNPTQGMDDSVRFILCAGSGLATGWFPVEGVLPTV
jgi:hypothetical protein